MRYLLIVVIWILTFPHKGFCSPLCIAGLKEYAESYTPKNEPNMGPDNVPVLSKEVVTELFNGNEQENSKYVVLILLRLYRAHLQCCNQGYELRSNDALEKGDSPLLYYFVTSLMGLKANQEMEFLSSEEVYKLVIRNEAFQAYGPIKKEMLTIEKQREEVRQELELLEKEINTHPKK